VHGSELSPGFPFPERELPHSVAVGHTETGHRVENAARELHLRPLSLHCAAPHASANDRLVPEDGILDHGAHTVARPLAPLASTKFSDGADVAVPFLQCG